MAQLEVENIEFEIVYSFKYLHLEINVQGNNHKKIRMRIDASFFWQNFSNLN